MGIRVGKTEKYINEKLESEGALLFNVTDPLDYESPEAAVSSAVSSAENGSDIVLVGGSIGAQGELLDFVTKNIKDKVNVPVVLFPGNIATITRYADALYFMSLLNARNPYWITQAQMLSAPVLKSMNVEALPVGYIVISPGGTVGWVGDANLVPREKPKIAAALALAGEYLGNRFIITDVGSNPQAQGFTSVPFDMIKEVRHAISVPYIIAGGINEESAIRNSIKSGADIIQIGTAIEQAKSAGSRSKFFSQIIKDEGRKRLKKGKSGFGDA
jgi:phosphoglycerol geranylgeranyltransferase